MRLRALLLLLALAATALPWALVDAQPVPPVPPAPAPPPAAEPAEAAEVSTIRLPLPAMGWTLDPHSARDAESFRLCAALYDSLYTYAPQATAEIRPALAEAMPVVSPDGLTWTIKLRKDARVHNNAAVFGEARTRNLKAQDVVDSLKRLAVRGPDESMYWLIGGVIAGLDEYGQRGRDDMQQGCDDVEVAGLSAPDDSTIKLKLTRPFGGLLSVLAHPCTGIIPREAIDLYGHELRLRPIGTGPYRLHAIADRQLLVLKRFDGHWGEKPAFERVTLQRMDSAPAMYEQFAKGQLARADVDDSGSLRTLMPGDKPGPLLQQAGVEPLWTDDIGMYFMVFNMDDAQWGAQDEDGRLLRKAVSLALDRTAIATDSGFADPWSRPQPEAVPQGTEFADLVAAHPMGTTDAKAAKAALDASKYKGGKDPATGDALVLEVVLQNTSMHSALGKSLKKSLQPLGITVITRFVRGDYRATMRGDTGSAFFSGWFMDSPDVQNFLQLFHGANAGQDIEHSNNARYRSEDFDKLYKQFEALLPTPDNAAKRRELTEGMLKLLVQDRPLVPLFMRRHCELRGKQVQWPILPPVTYNDLRHVKPSKTE